MLAPQQNLGPLAFLISLWQPASLRALEAEVLLTRGCGSVVLEEQEAWTGLGSCIVAGEESCSGCPQPPALGTSALLLGFPDKPPGTLSSHHPFPE